MPTAPTRLILCLAVALLGPGAAAAGQSWRTAPLGPDAVAGGGEYSTGGGISVAVEARDASGRLALCGVWAQSERLIVHIRRSARNVLATGSIAVNGRTVHRDLRFLNQVAPAASYAGTVPGCVLTDRPWRPGATPEIRIPTHMVYVGRGSEGGVNIRFQRSEAANPALLAGSVLPPDWATMPTGGWGTVRRAVQP